MPVRGRPAALRILPYMFAGVGLIMLILAVWLNNRERRFVARAARAVGTVTALEERRDSDGDRLYYPVVGFLAASGDSVSFRSSVGTNPPSYQPGDAVPVLYDPRNSGNARMAGFFSLYLGSFVTSLLALVFGGVGGVWLYMQRRAAAIAEELRRTGHRIRAKVVEVERRTNIWVGSRHPSRIVAQSQDPATGVVQTYRSANIWFDPTQYVGETVDVFVDGADARRYVVDLDFLPQESG